MMRPLVVTGNPPLGVFPVTQIAGRVPGVSYSVYNGVPPYTVASDNAQYPPASASVGFSGGQFFVPTSQSLLLNKPGTTVHYTVTDNDGKHEVVTLVLRY